MDQTNIFSVTQAFGN